MPKVITAKPIAEDGLSPERLARAGAATQELVELERQASTAARAVAQVIGYQLPADCTDPDLIQRDILINMRRSVESCLEVGRGLLVLKSLVGHGNFVQRLDVLNLEVRVAQRFMQSAKKFSNASSTPLLTAAGNQTKLFEMLVLDDEELEELALTGQTGELMLDDVATMSVKELRTSLREMKLEQAANEKLLHDKNAKLDKLTRGKGVTAPTNWEDAFKPLLDQQHVATTQIAFKLGDIKNVIDSSLQVEVPENEETSLHNARKILATQVKADLEQAKEQVEAALHYFDKTLDSWL